MKAILFTLLLISSAPTTFADSGENAMIAEVENAIIKQTNELRQEEGLPAVDRHDELTKAAADFAKFMAETGKYGHYADGKTPSARAKEANYQYCVVRENIAYRTNTGEVTADGLIHIFVQGWFDSPSHRENMLAEYVTQTGVAVATTDKETYYAVQLFGRPRSAAITLKITNESGESRTLVLEAGDSSDEIELPVRSSVTVTRCLPTSIRLSDQEESITLNESTDLGITSAGLKTHSDL